MISRPTKPTKSFTPRYNKPISIDLTFLRDLIRGKLPKSKFLDNPKNLILLTYVLTFLLVSMVVGLFAVVVVFAFFSRELPNPNKLLERNFELSTRFYDRNGKLLY